MKSTDEINFARSVVCDRMVLPGLSDVQIAVFNGMSAALCWVAENPNGKVLEDLLTGRQIAAGKDHASAMSRFRKEVSKTVDQEAK